LLGALWIVEPVVELPLPREDGGLFQFVDHTMADSKVLGHENV
jgi:hypothetical protein